MHILTNSNDFSLYDIHKCLLTFWYVGLCTEVIWIICFTALRWSTLSRSPPTGHRTCIRQHSLIWPLGGRELIHKQALVTLQVTLYQLRYI